MKHYPSWWEPGPTLDMLVNRNEWENLPKEYQEIFRTATYEANITLLSQYDTLNGEALARLVAGGTKLVAYSQEIMEAAQKATLEIFEENAIKDAQFKQIYKQWKEFRDKIYRWNRVNELSFANFTTKKLSL